jgi:hypothetical protein
VTASTGRVGNSLSVTGHNSSRFHMLTNGRVRLTFKCPGGIWRSSYGDVCVRDLNDVLWSLSPIATLRSCVAIIVCDRNTTVDGRANDSCTSRDVAILSVRETHRYTAEFSSVRILPVPCTPAAFLLRVDESPCRRPNCPPNIWRRRRYGGTWQKCGALENVLSSSSKLITKWFPDYGRSADAARRHLER